MNVQDKRNANVKPRQRLGGSTWGVRFPESDEAAGPRRVPSHAALRPFSTPVENPIELSSIVMQ